MSLLCNTDIDKKVNSFINGNICRIGGTVNQLLDYNNCKVTDLNIKCDRKIKYGPSLLGKLHYQYFLYRQEKRFKQIGWREVRDSKTIYADIHNIIASTKLHDSFDSTISSNVVEHSFNTIFFLLSTWLITIINGWQYHAIPCYRFTFDSFRTPTPLTHFITDFEAGLLNEVPEDADMHFADFMQSAQKSNWPVHDYEKRMPFLHYHVFDEINTNELLSFMFEEVTTDILRVPNQFSDVVVLFRNNLRRTFIDKYAELAQNIYGISLC